MYTLAVPQSEQLVFLMAMLDIVLACAHCVFLDN